MKSTDNIDLAHLRALHAAARLGGPMVSVHIISPGYEHCANLCTRLEGHKSDYPVAMMQAEWADCIAAIYNAFSALANRLEAAERERDERTVMAARAQEAMRYLLNGLPTNDAVWAAYGNADSARAWLADRDARMKALGAAEWLEKFAQKDAFEKLVLMNEDQVREEAARLRREAGDNGAQ